MLSTTALLLVTCWFQTLFCDQSVEVYRDETFFNNVPKFRDATEFDSVHSASDPVLVSLDGLRPNQHGFMLVNPQYTNRRLVNNPELTSSQRETVRRQEEFVRSVLEANKMRINQQNSQTGFRQKPTFTLPDDPRGSFDYQRVPLQRHSSPLAHTTDFQDVNLRPAVNIINTPQAFQRGSVRPEFSFSQRQQTDVRTAPSDLVQPVNDFNNFQSVSSFENNQPTFNSFPPQVNQDQQYMKNPSFSFRDASNAKPHSQTDFSHFGQVIRDSKTNPNKLTSPQANEGWNNQFRQRTHTNGEERRPSFKIKSAGSTEQKQSTQLANSGQDKLITRHRVNFVSVEQTSVAPPQPPKIDIQGLPATEDEESRFISRVNQNTASFVSNSGAASVNQDEAGIFEQALPQEGPADFEKPAVVEIGSRINGINNKRRKVVGLRTRKTNQHKAPSTENNFEDLNVLPLPATPTVNRPSQRFSSSSQEIGEENIDVEEEAKKQAESAKYSFASAVTDTVNDNSQVRKEVRDGLKLSGLYSYSDGFFKRTVFYEADENGYRVVKEESEPIGQGPQFDPNGEIEVNSQQSGSSLRYKIRGDQLPAKKTSKGRESNFGTPNDTIDP